MKRIHSLLLFLLPIVIGCTERNFDPPSPPRFEQLFEQNCRACHGTDGRMGPGPPLHDELFLKLASDDDLRRVITGGRPGTLMPGFHTDPGGRLLAPSLSGAAAAKPVAGPLTGEQVEQLVRGLRSWGPARTEADKELAAYAALLQPEPSMKGDPTRGWTVYETACAVCHGSDGQGVREGNKRKAGPLNSQALLALMSPQEIRRIIITGRPDLGMPSYREGRERGPDFTPLTPQDVADVAAHVLAWKQAPGGKQ